jgi:AcrR family transcriptional regulator
VPKDTFFKLPEEKRVLICDVALDEFAQYPYDQASVNRIVTDSGIAKGSFYQYFEDKKDLYLFLMGLIAEEKISYLSPTILNPDEHDFFALIRELFISGIRFASEHPRYAAIGNKLLANKDAPIFGELKLESLPSAYALFDPLIEKAVAKSEIRADLDVILLNFVIASMNLNIAEYWSASHPEEINESMIETVDAFIDILKNGIGTGQSEEVEQQGAT